jgi:hypothetical protein
MTAVVTDRWYVFTLYARFYARTRYLRFQGLEKLVVVLHIDLATDVMLCWFRSLMLCCSIGGQELASKLNERLLPTYPSSELSAQQYLGYNLAVFFQPAPLKSLSRRLE